MKMNPYYDPSNGRRTLVFYTAIDRQDEKLSDTRKVELAFCRITNCQMSQLNAFEMGSILRNPIECLSKAVKKNPSYNPGDVPTVESVAEVDWCLLVPRFQHWQLPYQPQFADTISQSCVNPACADA